MLDAPRIPGPDLATAAGVFDVHPERWHRALTTAVGLRWARTRAVVIAGVYALWALFCVVLWRIGYPGWRIAALVALLVAFVGVTLPALLRIRCADPTEVAGDERLPTALLALAVVVTGGVHSPLIVGLTANISSAIVHGGWTRGTRRALAAFLACALALGVAPARWFGPQIPEPTYTVTALVILVLAVAVHTDMTVMAISIASGAIKDLLRTRDEAASYALVRARELERVSSQLSHELKNPLGAIKALVQLSARSAQDEDTRARLEVVQGEVERMHGILQGYLSFSRPLDTLRPEPVALGTLVDEMLAVLEARAELARVALRRTGDARLTGDPRRLKEALLNLLANAIEASPPGGRVEVGIEERDGLVRLAVRDSGRGMPPDVLARIGTPFYSTREDGTGLGVLLARGVFVQHGGALEYESTPGRGTVATATLPVECRERIPDGERAAGR